MENQGGRGWRGRGFRPNHPFIQSRRPGEQPSTLKTATSKQQSNQKVQSQKPNHDLNKAQGGDVQLLVKYSYQANDKSPLGVEELSVKQGQKVTFINKHSVNDQWCNVRGEDGRQGYVPTSYVMELESKPSTLPWLQNTKDEEEETTMWSGPNKPIFKPYVPTYQEHKYELPKELKRFYCKICDKELNGIAPYNAHMASKAHKEELEYYEEQQNS